MPPLWINIFSWTFTPYLSLLLTFYLVKLNKEKIDFFMVTNHVNCETVLNFLRREYVLKLNFGCDCSLWLSLKSLLLKRLKLSICCSWEGYEKTKCVDKDCFENVCNRESNFHKLISRMFIRDRLKCPIQAATHKCHQRIYSVECYR